MYRAIHQTCSNGAMLRIGLLRQTAAAVAFRQSTLQTTQNLERIPECSILHVGSRSHKHSSVTIRTFLSDRDRVREFVDLLDHNERKLLLDELCDKPDNSPTPTDVSPTTTASVSDESTVDSELHPHPPPSGRQLSYLALQQSLPYISFGFLDNFIMIICGEYIELKLGIAFGISTMAAAGLGNTISDVAGVGSAYYIEQAFEKLGFHAPKMSLTQLQMARTRYTTQAGRMLGIAIGCIIGMAPLLFIDHKKSNKQEEADEQKSPNQNINPASA